MLDDPIQDEEAKMHHERNRRLYNYSFKVVETVIALNPVRGSYKGAIQAVYMRAYYCLYSLSKLDRAGDFQAVRATARTLFELYLDLMFLSQNVDSYMKYHAFNKLGSMKAALELTDFMESNPAERHEVRYFGELEIATDPSKLAECKMLLMSLYGRTEGEINHSLSGAIPENWTGMKSYKRIQQLDLDFLEYFKTEVCQSNWYVHGGAVGIGGRTQEMFVSIWSRGHDLSFRLMQNLTYIAFKELEVLDSVPDLMIMLRSIAK